MNYNPVISDILSKVDIYQAQATVSHDMMGRVGRDDPEYALGIAKQEMRRKLASALVERQAGKIETRDDPMAYVLRMDAYVVTRAEMLDLAGKLFAAGREDENQRNRNLTYSCTPAPITKAAATA